MACKGTGHLRAGECIVLSQDLTSTYRHVSIIVALRMYLTHADYLVFMLLFIFNYCTSDAGLRVLPRFLTLVTVLRRILGVFFFWVSFTVPLPHTRRVGYTSCFNPLCCIDSLWQPVRCLLDVCVFTTVRFRFDAVFQHGCECVYVRREYQTFDFDREEGNNPERFDSLFKRQGTKSHVDWARE